MLARPSVVRSVTSATRRGFTLLEVLVVVTIIVILASLASFAVFRNLQDAKINQATLQAQKISSAAEVYFVNTGGAFPTSLEMLALGDNSGGPPLLVGGQSALMDPWSNQFQFEVVNDQTGTPRFVVYTTAPTGARIQWPRN